MCLLVNVMCILHILHPRCFRHIQSLIKEITAVWCGCAQDVKTTINSLAAATNANTIFINARIFHVLCNKNRILRFLGHIFGLWFIFCMCDALIGFYGRFYSNRGFNYHLYNILWGCNREFRGKTRWISRRLHWNGVWKCCTSFFLYCWDHIHKMSMSCVIWVSHSFKF